MPPLTCPASYIENDSGGTTDVAVWHCDRPTGHEGIHRQTGGKEAVDREWYANELFLGPPYPGIGCDSKIRLEDDATVLCTRPLAHDGLHGNQHTDGAPELWSDNLLLDTTPLSGLTASKTPYADPGQGHAKVEIVIDPGTKSVPSKVRINGWQVPNLHNVEVHYEPKMPRILVLEILATDLVEVPE